MLACALRFKTRFASSLTMCTRLLSLPLRATLPPLLLRFTLGRMPHHWPSQRLSFLALLFIA